MGKLHVYNYKKIVKNKGSAIFLHLTKNYLPTKGCIALRERDFLILSKLIKKTTKIKKSELKWAQNKWVDSTNIYEPYPNSKNQQLGTKKPKRTLKLGQTQNLNQNCSVLELVPTPDVAIFGPKNPK